MESKVVHSPEAHIPIATVSAEGGVIYLHFKKSKYDVYETMTLDQFLNIVILTIYGYLPEDYFER